MTEVYGNIDGSAQGLVANKKPQPLTTLSYGGGWQSTALLVLAAQGRLPIDAALFANVGDDSEHPGTLAYVRDIAVPWAAEHGVTVHMLSRTRRDGSTETLRERLTRPGNSIRAAPRTAASPLMSTPVSGRSRRYPPDTTAAEWKLIEPLLPTPACRTSRGGRPEAHDRRAIVDAIRYIVDNGAKCRVWVSNAFSDLLRAEA